MKAEWKAFLQNNGAEFADDGRLHFGMPERESKMAPTGNVFADLSYQGLIAMRGPDAQKFLQGQFSNDVNQVTPQHSHLSSYCTAKGRMLASFRLFQRDDTYYLRLPAAMVEATLNRLRMYVLRAQVTLEDAPDALVRIGVSGPQANAEVTGAVGGAPEAVDDVVQTGEITVIRVPGVQPRFEIYGTQKPMTKVWETLNVRGAPIGTHAWDLLEVLAGIPTIYPPNMEAFVPQMVNLDVLGGVNFKKGCYPGQEVVARTQYLGKLKRRMYLGVLPAGSTPSPGDELFSAQGKEQSVGRIVDAQPHPDGGYAALAVIQIASADEGKLHLGSVKGPKFVLQELPYSLGET